MTLTTYLNDYLGDLYSQLGWSASSLTLIVTDTLNTYGVDTEEEATDTVKLNALGVYYLWKKVLRDLTLTGFDYSADGVSLKRSQMIENAEKQYRLALSDALLYLPQGQITSYSRLLRARDEFGGVHYVPYYSR